MSVSAPSRSRDQRMAALAHATEIRVNKAIVKRKMKAGEMTVFDAMDCKWASSFRVEELLTAIPKYGRVKARKIMSAVQVSPLRRLGALTDRQLSALREELKT